MSDLEKCKTCMYHSKTYPDSVYGECRRHAPITEPVSNSTLWPQTHISAWCGQWEYKPFSAESSKE